MLTLGKLIGRRRKPDDAADADLDPDEAIIHQSVPKAVLDVPREDVPEVDRSWMEAVPLAGSHQRAATQPRALSPPQVSDIQEDRADEIAESDGRDIETGDSVGQVANPAASARPRFPCGWLVVVEGPGVGEWFVLERGVSQIGSAEGQTVRLDFGDDTVRPTRHAVVACDTTRHDFTLESGPDAAVRVNGVGAGARHALRDGDVISVGGTSLRLVALCSPNFHWDPQLGAG